MKSTRGLIACALVAAVLLGPLSPSARAQQPAPLVVDAPPAVIVEVEPPDIPRSRSVDVYDVGAGVVTVARVPFNVALCAIGTGVGTALFLLTFGSAYKATTRVFEEGCAQRWIVRGDDLRPRGLPGVFPDRSSEAYQNRR